MLYVFSVLSQFSRCVFLKLYGNKNFVQSNLKVEKTNPLHGICIPRLLKQHPKHSLRATISIKHTILHNKTHILMYTLAHICILRHTHPHNPLKIHTVVPFKPS